MKKPRKEESSSSKSEETDINIEQDLVTPGGELSSGIVALKQNEIR